MIGILTWFNSVKFSKIRVVDTSWKLEGGEREGNPPLCWKRATVFLPLIYLFNLRMLVRDIWQTGRES